MLKKELALPIIFALPTKVKRLAMRTFTLSEELLGRLLSDAKQ